MRGIGAGLGVLACAVAALAQDTADARWAAGAERAKGDRAAAIAGYARAFKGAAAKRDAAGLRACYLEVRGFERECPAADRAALADALAAALPEQADVEPFWADGLRLWRGERALAAGKDEAARKDAEVVRRAAQKAKDRHTEARACLLLADAYHAGGNAAGAAREAEAGRALADPIGDRRLVFLLRLSLARAADVAVATEAFETILGEFSDLPRDELLEVATAGATAAEKAKATAAAAQFRTVAERARGSGAAGGGGGNVTIAGNGALADRAAKARPDAVLLAFQRTDEGLAVVSTHLQAGEATPPDEPMAYHNVDGVCWATRGPLVAFEALAYGFTGTGAKSEERFPPFVRAFALGPGDRVDVRRDERCVFVAGKR